MIAGVLLDIEGTLVADKRYQPTTGALELLRALRARRVPLRLITNNTTHGTDELRSQLAQGGLDFAREEIITCIGAASALLRERRAQRCLVLGNDRLRALIREGGVNVVESAEADAVLVGLDTGLTFATLRRATEALASHGALLVALHMNRLYKDDAGRVAPSVGPVVSALSYAAQVEPLVVGKPSADFYGAALGALGLPAEQVLVISDDPFSDLAGAKRLGMRAAFVLCGKYHDGAVVQRLAAAERPDVISDDLAQLAATPLLAALLGR